MILIDNLYGMVNKDWTKQEILNEINRINNELESQVCENCIYFNNQSCNHDSIGLSIDGYVPLNFGCNKFKRKMEVST